MNSEREGLSRAMLQYLASGKPVVCSNIYGVDEVIKNNINGFLYEIGDKDGLYNAISNLLNDSKILSNLTNGAKNTDLSKWSIELMVKKIDELYNSELSIK